MKSKLKRPLRSLAGFLFLLAGGATCFPASSDIATQTELANLIYSASVDIAEAKDEAKKKPEIRTAHDMQALESRIDRATKKIEEA